MMLILVAFYIYTKKNICSLLVFLVVVRPHNGTHSTVHLMLFSHLTHPDKASVQWIYSSKPCFASYYYLCLDFCFLIPPACHIHSYTIFKLILHLHGCKRSLHSSLLCHNLLFLLCLHVGTFPNINKAGSRIRCFF